ncbi:MAG: hypothetical protein RIQ53_2834, partial [Pseudomonadota bacterium]
ALITTGIVLVTIMVLRRVPGAGDLVDKAIKG